MLELYRSMWWGLFLVVLLVLNLKAHSRRGDKMNFIAAAVLMVAVALWALSLMRGQLWQ